MEPFEPSQPQPETPRQSEPQLPPEAQGEVNGGPLGCCLGVTVGLLLSLSIAIVSRFYADPLAQLLHGGLSIAVRIVMILVALVAAILFGVLGWKLGKRFYREYELSPRQQRKLAALQQKQQLKRAHKRG
ncbi:MAG TPA: hypothetical protein VFA41_01220 [Ktedonobacteraceae bacterium]|nr:hypothetical protein [Ktedonobacteraceae bacterium]